MPNVFCQCCCAACDDECAYSCLCACSLSQVSEWVLASREAGCAVLFVAVTGIVFAGNGNVFRASASVVAANAIAAQARTLLTEHATAVANVGQRDFEVAGGA